jgi:hypothetical protein
VLLGFLCLWSLWDSRGGDFGNKWKPPVGWKVGSNRLRLGEKAAEDWERRLVGGVKEVSLITKGV